MLTIRALALISAVSAGAAHADLLIYEGFETPGDYTGGVDVTSSNVANPGEGFTSAWTNSGAADALLASATGLSYTDSNSAMLQVTDGSAQNPVTVRADVYSRTFALGFTPASGDELWMSLLFNRTDGNKGWAVTLDEGTPNATGGFGFGSSNNSGAVGAAMQQQFGNLLTVDNNETQFVVGRLTFNSDNPAGPPTMDVWLNPDLDEDLSAVAVGGGDSTFTRNYTGVVNTQNLVIYSHQDNAIIFDEIRVGTALADVVPIPEPGSLALVAAGSVLVVVRRRRG